MILAISTPSLLQLDFLFYCPTDKINEGTWTRKAGGPTIWPGALREGLGQPDLGLLADLAMA